MFESLKKHSKILVTGPHRSGTTIAATMIAHDTGHGLVKEELCNFRRDHAAAWLEMPCNVVVQCPFLADICHQFSVFVVYMIRDVGDIERSQGRMTLKNGKKCNWHNIENIEHLNFNSQNHDGIATLKYENWQQQKQRVQHLELNYETLAEHPLWVPREERTDFHVRQTRVA